MTTREISIDDYEGACEWLKSYGFEFERSCLYRRAKHGGYHQGDINSPKRAIDLVKADKAWHCEEQWVNHECLTGGLFWSEDRSVWCAHMDARATLFEPA